MNGRPVSVVIPVFNAASFMEDAIGLTSKQTYPPLGAIVAINGSADAMADMKTALQTYRIAHLRCRLSRGIIETHISEGAPSA